MSTVMKLSPHDRKELEKFTLFLSCKSVQVIVQSRLGQKQKTQCKAETSNSDWFNLDIPDEDDVQVQVNEAMAGQIPEPGGPSLCTEISLKTVDGDTLVLEVWQLTVSNVCDSSVRATYTVYNRMSLVLKSLITITRVMPAYRLSHNQSRDSYIICFNVYMGQPQLDVLGEDYKRIQVGQVGMPTGTLTLGVDYRTKMTISPQQAINQAHPAMMLKSDYFKPDLSPRGMRIRPSVFIWLLSSNFGDDHHIRQLRCCTSAVVTSNEVVDAHALRLGTNKALQLAPRLTPHARTLRGYEHNNRCDDGEELVQQVQCVDAARICGVRMPLRSSGALGAIDVCSSRKCPPRYR
ncbi:hypothetical protein HPB50_013375 [Hyalomma asiaticum]|uniref:Uncharacterized protein n=1 Tax=Hyalomma asiaticum TaxID=266040 RepID=A0ACB7SPZ6_HYAAI|nr:hypothetical protein HPB50_013375 [Hyalomma asiaticum]